MVKIHEQQKSEQGRTQGPRQRKKFPVEKSDCLSGRKQRCWVPRILRNFWPRQKTHRKKRSAQENSPEITPSAEVSKTPTPAPQEEISGGGEETSHSHTEECYEGEGSLICGNDTEKPDENMPGRAGRLIRAAGNSGTGRNGRKPETVR